MIVVEALLVGLAIGAVLGLIGAGGAVVAVPAFLYLFGFDPLAATTASLVVVGASATSGVIPRLRQQQVRVKQALVFWVLGVAGTFAGARLATVLPEPVIITGFAIVMLAAAVAMWRKSSRPQPTAERTAAPWLLVLVALAIGLLTGLFGVGGGFLIVPALVLVFAFPFGIATGTSLLIIALNSVTALVFKYDTWGTVEWTVPLLVVAGGLVGSVAASTLNHGIPARVLERTFAVVLVALAVFMAVETLVLQP